jgi:hypothetical protein
MPGRRASLQEGIWGWLQVKGIPFVVFDAGGVLEMFDHRQHPDNVVFEPTLEALASRLNGVRPPSVAGFNSHTALYFALLTPFFFVFSLFYFFCLCFPRGI